MDKVIRYMGLARRAGHVVCGSGTCMLPQVKRRLKLIIIAEDTARGSIEKVRRMAEQSKIPLRVYGRSEELSHGVGMPPRNVFGITDAGLADVIIKRIDS